jgi:hypothetical protein
VENINAQSAPQILRRDELLPLTPHPIAPLGEQLVELLEEPDVELGVGGQLRDLISGASLDGLAQKLPGDTKSLERARPGVEG